MDDLSNARIRILLLRMGRDLDTCTDHLSSPCKETDGDSWYGVQVPHIPPQPENLSLTLAATRLAVWIRRCLRS